MTEGEGVGHPSNLEDAMGRTVEKRLAMLTSAVPPSSKIVTGALRDTSPAVRSKAVQIVGEQKLDAALPIVEELLSDADEKVRIDAIACFRSFQNVPPNTKSKVRSLLNDKSFLARIEAMETLAYLNDDQALPAIASLLSDSNPLVRAYAARSIAALRGISYVQRLKDALGREKKDSARAGLLEALVILGERQAFTSLLELLSSADYRVRCAVANSLAEINLDQDELSSATSALVQAEKHAIAKADKITAARALNDLRKPG